MNAERPTVRAACGCYVKLPDWAPDRASLGDCDRCCGRRALRYRCKQRRKTKRLRYRFSWRPSDARPQGLRYDPLRDEGYDWWLANCDVPTNHQRYVPSADL